ncbi:P22 coat - protein 5 family protein [Duganella sp. FT94W]|uniref:P22 coat - protein 5 family protein n=1 Tax=Duganella lactea TaxID=2692173 RepID=A0ABW9V5G7_9BURK|nr:P22 phage major capsid protein family protein [Duganella lactea]MYM34931.1 P22 coat - protein 5 family protein [Duganella lactea]
MTILTLTGLIPDIYAAMNVIAREQVGFIPAVSRDSTAERAALNQTVRSPVVGAMAAEDLTQGAYAADAGDQTINYVDMTINKQRSVPFGINGDDTMRLQSAGTYANVNQQRIAQALRTLSNEVETDLATTSLKLSRAYGTPGTTPFGVASDLSDFSQPKKILKDNGAPLSDLHMVLGSGAAANLEGKQPGLFRVNEAGTDELLRRGAISIVQGFDLHNSGAIGDLIATGTAAGATTNNAGYAKGATLINLASAGTGTLLAGDIVKFAGDPNQYILAQGDTNMADGGQIRLQAPGLRQAIPPSATGITLIAATVRNAFFQRAAIQLATRAPAMPEGGDSADDVMMVTDPISGITYEFCIYKQKRQVRYEVNLAWGTAAPNPHLGGHLIGG